jgi:hypothetical protein
VNNVQLEGQPVRQLNRWTSWARSMSARHERFMMRRGPLLMTLLEPLRMSVAISQRRESFALSVFPRLQISVSSILQQIAPAEFQSFFRNSAVLAGGDRREWRSLRQFVQTNQSVSVSNTVTRNLVTSESNSVVNAQYEFTQFLRSPVARFFARVQRSHHGTVLLKNLLVEHDSQAIAERVVREHARVEQRRQREMIIRKDNATPAATTTRQHSLEQQFASTKTEMRPWPRNTWPDKPPEINVDQLTEQVIRKIDHRITAYRERLGRAF